MGLLAGGPYATIRDLQSGHPLHSLFFWDLQPGPFNTPFCGPGRIQHVSKNDVCSILCHGEKRPRHVSPSIPRSEAQVLRRWLSLRGAIRDELFEGTSRSRPDGPVKRNTSWSMEKYVLPWIGRYYIMILFPVLWIERWHRPQGRWFRTPICLGHLGVCAMEPLMAHCISCPVPTKWITCNQHLFSGGEGGVDTPLE